MDLIKTNFIKTIKDYALMILTLACIILGFSSAGMFDQTVNAQNESKRAVNDVGATKIRVQQIDDQYIDWGDPEKNRPSFIAAGLFPFGNDKDVMLGLRSDGTVMWRYADRREVMREKLEAKIAKEKVEKIAKDLKDEAAQKN